MKPTRVLLALGPVVAATLLGLPGCGSSDNDQATKTAKDALGVSQSGEVTTADRKREVLVRDKVEVIDRQTGKVLSEKTKLTPVTVETKVKENTDVKAGATERVDRP